MRSPESDSSYPLTVPVHLRRNLAQAIKGRDSVAVSALRSALAAIENAEAVDPVKAPEAGPGRGVRNRGPLPD